MTDHELLQGFIRERSQDAFRTLVERHLPLVYSAARRQVRGAHLAEEVAQSVFLDLSREAAALPADQSLVAWLHVVTRRAAIDVVRREVRRQAREQEVALAATVTMSPTPDPWAEVEPLLDEAVETLGEPDRTAILLRFFQNKSLREVGAALGTSDDAAQKRVTRALDQLHRFFVRRGVVVTAAGLATELSARALHTVPAGLSASISATTSLSVAGAGATAAAAEGGRVLLMTTLQKSLIAAALVVAGSAGLYQASLAATQADQLSGLAAQNARLASEVRDQQAQRTTVAAKLQEVERRIDAGLVRAPVMSAADTVLTAQMEQWLGQMDRLKDFLKQRPELSLPEIALLTDLEWFNIVSTGKKLETDDELRQSARSLRHRAENLFASQLFQALQAYLRAHPDTLPTKPADLAPFFTDPVDPAVFERYEMLQQGKVSAVAPRDRMRMISPKAPADPEIDAYWTIGASGYGSSSAITENFRRAQEAYGKANAGAKATAPDQLKPFLPWPMSDGALEKIMSRTPTP